MFDMTAKQWKAFEAIATEARNREQTRELAEGAIQLIGELMYLDGCVKRGRGKDIDPGSPTSNVFEYIKELERKINNPTNCDGSGDVKTIKQCACKKPIRWSGDNYCRECNGLITCNCPILPSLSCVEGICGTCNGVVVNNATNE